MPRLPLGIRAPGQSRPLFLASCSPSPSAQALPTFSALCTHVDGLSGATDARARAFRFLLPGGQLKACMLARPHFWKYLLGHHEPRAQARLVLSYSPVRKRLRRKRKRTRQWPGASSPRPTPRAPPSQSPPLLPRIQGAGTARIGTNLQERGACVPTVTAAGLVLPWAQGSQSQGTPRPTPPRASRTHLKKARTRPLAHHFSAWACWLGGEGGRHSLVWRLLEAAHLERRQSQAKWSLAPEGGQRPPGTTSSPQHSRHPSGPNHPEAAAPSPGQCPRRKQPRLPSFPNPAWPGGPRGEGPRSPAQLTKSPRPRPRGHSTPKQPRGTWLSKGKRGQPGGRGGTGPPGQSRPEPEVHPHNGQEGGSLGCQAPGWGQRAWDPRPCPEAIPQRTPRHQPPGGVREVRPGPGPQPGSHAGPPTQSPAHQRVPGAEERGLAHAPSPGGPNSPYSVCGGDGWWPQEAAAPILQVPSGLVGARGRGRAEPPD